MAKGPGDRPGDRLGGLSKEDQQLWLEVTRDLKPLRKAARKPKNFAPEPASTSGRPVAKPAPPATPPRTASPALERGAAAGVDRRQAQRLKRGQMKIDGTLDLHGSTQAEAHRRLERALSEAQAAGKRCLLVITGRGIGKSEGGVLRTQVPRWLSQPPNRARVLAFDIAQPKHGGDGALYVLLRRNRPD